MKMVKPENKKFKFNGQMLSIKDLTLEQARKAKKYAHAMSNGYGWNDDAKMQTTGFPSRTTLTPGFAL